MILNNQDLFGSTWSRHYSPLQESRNDGYQLGLKCLPVFVTWGGVAWRPHPLFLPPSGFFFWPVDYRRKLRPGSSGPACPGCGDWFCPWRCLPSRARRSLLEYRQVWAPRITFTISTTNMAPCPSPSTGCPSWRGEATVGSSMTCRKVWLWSRCFGSGGHGLVLQQPVNECLLDYQWLPERLHFCIW